jgi:hypothetical protein
MVRDFEPYFRARILDHNNLEGIEETMGDGTTNMIPSK